MAAKWAGFYDASGWMAAFRNRVSTCVLVTHYKETALASKHYYMGSQRLASAMINYWPYGDEVPTGDPGGGPSPGEPGEGGDDGGGAVGEFPAHYSNPGTDGALQNLQSTMNCLGGTELVQLDWANLLPWCSWGAGGSQEAMVFSFRRKAENIGSQQSAGSAHYQLVIVFLKETRGIAEWRIGRSIALAKVGSALSRIA